MAVLESLEQQAACVGAEGQQVLALLQALGPWFADQRGRQMFSRGPDDDDGASVPFGLGFRRRHSPPWALQNRLPRNAQPLHFSPVDRAVPSQIPDRAVGPRRDKGCRLLRRIGRQLPVLSGSRHLGRYPTARCSTGSFALAEEFRRASVRSQMGRIGGPLPASFPEVACETLLEPRAHCHKKGRSPPQTPSVSSLAVEEVSEVSAGSDTTLSGSSGLPG